MTTVFSPFIETDPEEFARATEITYLGTVWGTRSALTGCSRGTGARWCRWGPRSPTAGSRCRAPTRRQARMKGFTESIRCELRARHSKVHLTMVQLPGAQHAAVRSLSQSDAGPPDARGSDLSA